MLKLLRTLGISDQSGTLLAVATLPDLLEGGEANAKLDADALLALLAGAVH